MSQHDELIRKIQERARADREKADQLIADSGLGSNSTLVNALEPEYLAGCFRDLKEEILADMFGTDASSEKAPEEKKPWWRIF